MSEFIKIIIQILRIDKKFFINSKNFGEASIYFAILIIVLAATAPAIPSNIIIKPAK